MKKYFYVAALVSAFILTGCKGNPDEPKETKSIKVKYEAREIAVGDEIKLEVEATPSTLALTYTSSDPAVASVTSFGLITGKEIGEATIIVSAEGAEPDSCKIYVLDASDLFVLGGFTLWDLGDEPMSDWYDTVSLSDGTAPHCRIMPGEWHVWDNNLSFDHSAGRIAGAGYVLIIDSVPTYVIDDDDYFDGKYNGYYIGTRTLEFSEDATADSAYMVKPGKILDLQKWGDFLDDVDTTLTLEDCVYGPAVYYIDYTAQKSYPYQGFVGEGIIRGNYAEVNYKQTIDWLGGIYGLAYDVNEEEQTYEIRHPYELLQESRYYEVWEDETAEGEEEENVYTKHKFVGHQQMPIDFHAKKPTRTDILFKK